MADPIASWDAREPKSSDLDPDGTVARVGGDELTPSRYDAIVDRVLAAPVKTLVFSGIVFCLSLLLQQFKAPTEMDHTQIRRVMDIYVRPEHEDLGRITREIQTIAQALIGGLTLSVILTIFLVPAGFFLACQNKPLEVSV